MFILEKRKKEKEEQISRKSGIIINNPPEIGDNNPLFFVLTNALINFLIVYGGCGCFILAFDVKINIFVVGIVSLLIACSMGFFYYNRGIKAIGYLIALVIFLYMILNQRYLIRGGFAHICNKMMLFFEKELDLPIERSYEVYGYDEKISVTVCILFIIFCVMMMFNMAISETKGFVIAFLFSFPVVQMPLYFGLEVNAFFFAMYMAGIISLIFFKNSSHYHMEYKKRRGYKKYRVRNKVTFNYTNDGKNTLGFLCSVGTVLIILVLVTGFVLDKVEFKPDTKYDEWKDSTYDFTKRFVMVGFWGMLSPNGGSAGGVGRNRMGQSKYVELDYETDLIVNTVIEEKEDTIYLKNFNGTFYKDAYWETISERKPEIKLEDYGLTPEKVSDLNGEMEGIYHKDNILGKNKKIKIINVAANPNYSYVPYNTVGVKEISENMKYDDEILFDLKRNWYFDLWYTPFLRNYTVDEFREKINFHHSQHEIEFQSSGNEGALEKLEREEKYSQYVHDMYMEVPEENKKSIEKFCKKYNLTEDTENIVEKLSNIFENDYEYTLIPGKTPAKKEFVNYFLDKQKKGYCVYFATSSTLIFRYLGIPARYAGGYAIQPGDFDTGESCEENIVEYIHSLQYLDKEVLQFEVDDSQAHAWVEIYIDGFGWLPVDTTPSTEEEEEEKIPEPEDNAVINYLMNTVFTKETYDAVKDTFLKIIIITLGTIISAVTLYVIVGSYIRKRRKNAATAEKLYDYLCKCTAAVKIRKNGSENYRTFAERIAEADLSDEKVINEISCLVEKEKFSKSGLNNEEVEVVRKNVICIRDNIYNKKNLFGKIIFKYIRFL